LVRERDLRKRAAEVRIDLEKDERDTFDMLKAQLGKFADTPLGKAALKKVEGKTTKLAPVMEGVESTKPPADGGERTLDDVTTH
jgi:hypothetical protein